MTCGKRLLLVKHWFFATVSSVPLEEQANSMLKRVVPPNVYARLACYTQRMLRVIRQFDDVLGKLLHTTPGDIMLPRSHILS